MARNKIVGHPVQSKVPVESLAGAIITYMREGNNFTSHSMADFVRWCVESKVETTLTRQQAARFLTELGVSSEGVIQALQATEE